MSEPNQELEALRHLLEIEKQASVLVDSAEAEAEKIMSKSHADYNAEYKSKADVLAAQLDAEFKKSNEKIIQKHKDALEDYKKEFAARPLNKKALFDVLDKLVLA